MTNNRIPECSCSKTHLTRRVVSGGMVQFWMQCLRCGKATSQSLSKSKASQIAGRMGFSSLDDVAPWDQELRNSFERKLAEAFRAEHHRRQEQWNAEKWERSEAYQQYLLTPQWRSIRALVMRRANWKCEGCLQADAEEVHHRKYPREWGCEFLFDLVALCSSCHERIHSV